MIAPIAQIVVDLPLEGPFDYLIPDGMKGCVQVGMRVMVPFGARPACGFVIGFVQESHIPKLKSISSVCESQSTFTPWMIEFAKGFSRHYGCSLGESLATMLPPLLRKGRFISHGEKLSSHCERSEAISVTGIASALESRPRNDKATVFISPNGDYSTILHDQIAPVLKAKASVLVLVPDATAMKQISVVLNQHFSGQVLELKDGATLKEQVDHWVKVRNARNSIVLGTRSAVFAPIGDVGLMLMIDEEDASYKQEQSPLYETRDVMLMRAQAQGLAVAFCSQTPSVDLWHGLTRGHVQRVDADGAAPIKPQAVDLSNYKFIGGMLSPPLRNGLDDALKSRGKGILVLNRRGSYSVTRCVDCGTTLKCQHCDSPLMYSRAQKKFCCRFCTFSLSGDAVCPSCQKANWKSFGVGVEHLQKELSKYFPIARIASFEGSDDEIPKDWDILITTQVVLRLSTQLKAAVVACLDFDAELSRMDIRSSFRAFSLVRHLSVMATKQCFVQSRNCEHYVIRSLIRGDVAGFYAEELALRKEMGFVPFKHWVQIMCRSRIEKSALDFAQCVYNELVKAGDKRYALSVPRPDAMLKKRDQFRFNVMVQGDEVIATMDYVKAALARIKRSSRVIVTFNVDA